MNMKTITVVPESEDLAYLAKRVAAARNIVALAGAGMSQAAGIPDFHSEGGRYETGNPFLQSALLTEEGKRKFMTVALNLRDDALKSQPTKTHQLFLQLQQDGRLLRLYTQNIDGLDAQVGLSTDVPTDMADTGTCIPLHGNIRMLKCRLCSAKYEWKSYEKEGAEVSQDTGIELSCQSCWGKCRARVADGRRKIAIGRLYPDIICSDQPHPDAVEIQQLIDCDEDKADILIILGTSLKFSGPLKLAKQLADAVDSRGGLVVFVNRTEPPLRAAEFIHYWIKTECDSWAEDLRLRMEQQRMEQQRMEQQRMEQQRMEQLRMEQLRTEQLRTQRLRLERLRPLSHRRAVIVATS